MRDVSLLILLILWRFALDERVRERWEKGKGSAGLAEAEERRETTGAHLATLCLMRHATLEFPLHIFMNIYVSSFFDDRFVTNFK